MSNRFPLRNPTILDWWPIATHDMATRESSIRFSPIRDEVLALFGDPVPV